MRQSTVPASRRDDAEGQRHDDHRHLPSHRDTDQNQLRAMIDPPLRTARPTGSTGLISTWPCRRAPPASKRPGKRSDAAERRSISEQVLASGSASASARRRREYSADLWPVSGYRGCADRCSVRHHGGDSDTTGGFDTHGNVAANDGANGSFAQATNRITYLWHEAARTWHCRPAVCSGGGRIQPH